MQPNTVVSYQSQPWAVVAVEGPRAVLARVVPLRGVRLAGDVPIAGRFIGGVLPQRPYVRCRTARVVDAERLPVIGYLLGDAGDDVRRAAVHSAVTVEMERRYRKRKDCE